MDSALKAIMTRETKKIFKHKVMLSFVLSVAAFLFVGYSVIFPWLAYKDFMPPLITVDLVSRYLAFGSLFLFLFLPATFLIESFREDNETMEALLATPVSIRSLILGKSLALMKIFAPTSLIIELAGILAFFFLFGFVMPYWLSFVCLLANIALVNGVIMMLGILSLYYRSLTMALLSVPMAFAFLFLSFATAIPLNWVSALALIVTAAILNLAGSQIVKRTKIERVILRNKPLSWAVQSPLKK